jgi:hypothetical protein
VKKDKKIKVLVGEEPSKKFKLNETDYKKIGKGALIAFGGAFLVSLGEWLSTGSVELWKPALVAAVSVGINAVWKYLQSQ